MVPIDATISISVIISAIGLVWSLINWKKNNDREFIYKLQSVMIDKEYRNAWAAVRKSHERKDTYVDIVRGCEYEYEVVLGFFDSLGTLLKKNFVDSQMLTDIFGKSIIRAWERSKSYVDSARIEVKDPELYDDFEYLYTEIHKRLQTRARTTIRPSSHSKDSAKLGIHLII
ncbi:hypothetical protein AC480_06060 [miscellaneous Crenarchaeota group archaeon SMTZ1-55]|nr:MAG: hypothetical protein AC480_06060 [miscellaneous Crenarchaeota group archaeon SMTZ1-55]